MLACPHHRGETSTTIWGVGSRHVTPIATYGRILRPVIARNGGRDASPTEGTRCGHLSSHVLIRTERADPPRSRALPLGRDKAVRSRDRPLNRKTPSDRPTLMTPPQRTTDHPEQPIERGEHNSRTSPKEGNARIDDEPLHHEAHGAGASATTTRKPTPGPHTARVVERARKRNTVAETHFRSDLSG